MFVRFALIMLGLPFLLSGCAGMELTSGNVVLTDHGTQAGIVFTSRDRTIIDRYYANLPVHKRMPPGLARREHLPPGLVKRDRLPRGLRGRGLPAALERQLHSLPTGYVRIVVGNDLVLMDRSSRVVMDIYRDVVR
jgi:hypothetical protein